MTVTITARRLALVVLTAISLVVYLIGATRSGGAPAAASTFTKTVDSSPSQPSTIPVLGGARITVGGSALVAGTSDTLLLDLSVVATASSVSEALTSANLSADAVQTSLLGHGVAKKDLQTSGLDVQPNYDYSSSGTPHLAGYHVSESVSAKLRDLGRAGDAIGKAVTSGGDAVRVNGISLDLEDTGALVSRARDKAFADAQAKAVQYAKDARRTVGDVVSITEDVAAPSPTPLTYAAGPSPSTDKASVPIQPGSQDVSVRVTVVFAMT